MCMQDWQENQLYGVMAEYGHIQNYTTILQLSTEIAAVVYLCCPLYICISVSINFPFTHKLYMH